MTAGSIIVYNINSITGELARQVVHYVVRERKDGTGVAKVHGRNLNLKKTDLPNQWYGFMDEDARQAYYEQQRKGEYNEQQC